MSYDNGLSFPETKDHYHSTKCKTCDNISMEI